MRCWTWKKPSPRPDQRPNQATGVSDRYVEVARAWECAGYVAGCLGEATAAATSEDRWRKVLAAQAVGPPVGAEAWIKGLETRLGVSRS